MSPCSHICPKEKQLFLLAVGNRGEVEDHTVLCGEQTRVPRNRLRRTRMWH